MHKLVILIEPPKDDDAFDDMWPQFLHLAENMPGLRRETTSRVDGILFGQYDIALIHELYFDSLTALKEAMSSLEGQAAGEILQRMTAGRMTLVHADHKEDELENIHKYRQQRSHDEN